MKKPAISRKEMKANALQEKIPRRTLSLYRYVRIQNPQAMRDELFVQLSEMGCLGRIYVASEGINAQMNVPTANFKQFDTYLQGKK